MKDEEGEAKAKIFFVAYEKLDVEDVDKRPITFAFNGGPGSSSVWLHLGILGPKRVLLDDDGKAMAPPFSLVDNESSVLDKTDLVFIDPVSTGYSRPAKGEDPKQFHGVQEDVQSVGDFIRLYTTREGRWSSPKFLSGESYGTTRASALSGYLQDRHGMYLNGIVLVSAVLDFQTIRFTVGNDLPYVLFFPSYTTTAWYHKKLPEDLQSMNLEDLMKESREYAQGPYATALLMGDRLSGEEYAGHVRQIARLTGLSEYYVERSNLRIQIFQFTKELLRDEKRTVGRFDSRIKGIDREAVGDSPDYDPSYAAVQGPYTGCLNDYVRKDLNFKTDLPYEILTGRVHPWNYEDYENRYVNVGDTLQEAISKNPYLKVFVANGYYDLATPFLATEYTFAHLGLDASLRGNVSMGYYEAGHMMYTHKESLEKLGEDLDTFYDQTLQLVVGE
ncbi:MAG: peptidase S10 [Candidatus Omnitrophica bacterium]|nr:peptidase S10 [Candidatus Omnitrophota bacterium]